MLPRTIQTYGGPYVDELAVQNPESEESAAYGNRSFEDLAQLSATPVFARVKFATQTGGSSVAVISAVSQMGTGSGQNPTIARTGVGLYTITYPTSWVDPLGQSETIVVNYSGGSVKSTSSFGRVQTTDGTNVVTVAVLQNIAGVDTLSDLGGSVTLDVWAGF